MLRVCASLLLAVVVVACASTGRKFSPDLIPRIHICQTTQDEVRQLFGQPVGLGARGSGGTEWRYEFEETKTRSTESLSKITCFVTSILGRGVCTGPLDISYEKRNLHRIDVYFDGNGVVEDYFYQRVDEPSRAVY